MSFHGKTYIYKRYQDEFHSQLVMKSLLDPPTFDPAGTQVARFAKIKFQCSWRKPSRRKCGRYEDTVDNSDQDAMITLAERANVVIAEGRSDWSI
jgi:hypothetical protein